MMKWLALAFAIVACGNEAPSSKAGSGSQKPKHVRTPYTGPIDPHGGAVTHPCHDAVDCKLVDHCGCSCQGEIIESPPPAPCEESCPDEGHRCDGYTVVCEEYGSYCRAVPPPGKDR